MRLSCYLHQSRRFDYASFPTGEEARHACMRLWREFELAAERRLAPSHRPVT